MAIDFSGIASRIGSEVENFGNHVVNRAKQGAIDAVSETGFGRALRMVGLLDGANPLSSNFAAGAWDTGANTDWRVRLSIPPTSEYQGSALLNPLKETNGLIWPYTPTVTISHSANYNGLSPVHSNYAFQLYQNSTIDAMTISGEFTVENSLEAEYWVAALHYLKSVTKMAYGDSANRGNPPPVVRLNGYGDYVFKDVPVVITNFTTNMDADVDYIEAPNSPNGTWVPTRSTITVTCIPAYSRDTVNRFNLNDFVSGNYIFDDTGYV